MTLKEELFNKSDKDEKSGSVFRDLHSVEQVLDNPFNVIIAEYRIVCVYYAKHRNVMYLLTLHHHAKKSVDIAFTYLLCIMKHTKATSQRRLLEVHNII